ncbi:MAG: DsrE family protein, partial [Candidatus Limnocylindria bacterium]
IQLATGPENSTRAALAFLVARTAAADGHDVTLFLAGDAVSLLRDATMDATVGVGTGSVREHYTALAESGVRVYASGLSSRARALDAEAMGGKPVEFVPPNRLVELIAEADRVVTY